MTDPAEGNQVTTPATPATAFTGAGWYPIVADKDAVVVRVIGSKLITFCWTGSFPAVTMAGRFSATSQPPMATPATATRATPIHALRL